MSDSLELFLEQLAVCVVDVGEIGVVSHFKLCLGLVVISIFKVAFKNLDKKI